MKFSINFSNKRRALTNKFFNHKVTFNSLEELCNKRSLFDYDHCLSGKVRGINDFEEITCAVFDFDNDMEDIDVKEEALHRLLKQVGVTYFLVYSKSHMIEKGDHPARFRGKIYFPLAEAITDYADARDYFTSIQKLVFYSMRHGFCYCDKAVKPVHLLSSTPHFDDLKIVEGGKLLDEVYAVEETIKDAKKLRVGKGVNSERVEANDSIIDAFIGLFYATGVPCKPNLSNGTMNLATDHERTRFGYYVSFPQYLEWTMKTFVFHPNGAKMELQDWIEENYGEELLKAFKGTLKEAIKSIPIELQMPTRKKVTTATPQQSSEFYRYCDRLKNKDADYDVEYNLNKDCYISEQSFMNTLYSDIETLGNKFNLLTSPTGSGKSRIPLYFLNKGYKVIYVNPRVKWINDNYNKREEVYSGYTVAHYQKVGAVGYPDMIYTTDKSCQLSKGVIEDLCNEEKVVIIVDEPQILNIGKQAGVDMGFAKVLAQENALVLFTTATPNYNIEYLMGLAGKVSKKHYKLSKFQVKQDKFKHNVDVIATTSNIITNEYLYEHLKEDVASKPADSKIIYQFSSKTQLQAFAEMIRNRPQTANLKIEEVTADERDSTVRTDADIISLCSPSTAVGYSYDFPVHSYRVILSRFVHSDNWLEQVLARVRVSEAKGLNTNTQIKIYTTYRDDRVKNGEFNINGVFTEHSKLKYEATVKRGVALSRQNKIAKRLKSKVLTQNQGFLYMTANGTLAYDKYYLRHIATEEAEEQYYKRNGILFDLYARKMNPELLASATIGDIKICNEKATRDMYDEIEAYNKSKEEALREVTNGQVKLQDIKAYKQNREEIRRLERCFNLSIAQIDELALLKQQNTYTRFNIAFNVKDKIKDWAGSDKEWEVTATKRHANGEAIFSNKAMNRRLIANYITTRMATLIRLVDATSYEETYKHIHAFVNDRRIQDLSILNFIQLMDEQTNGWDKLGIKQRYDRYSELREQLMDRDNKDKKTIFDTKEGWGFISSNFNALFNAYLSHRGFATYSVQINKQRHNLLLTEEEARAKGKDTANKHNLTGIGWDLNLLLSLFDSLVAGSEKNAKDVDSTINKVIECNNITEKLDVIKANLTPITVSGTVIDTNVILDNSDKGYEVHTFKPETNADHEFTVYEYQNTPEDYLEALVN